MESSLTDEITKVMEEFEIPLLRYASRLLQDPDLARDIVQDTFIKYLRYRGEENGTIENTKTWLYRVAHNLAVDFIRKNRRREEAAADLDGTKLHGKTAAPDLALDLKDARALVIQELGKLTEREQHIIILKLEEEKSYKEIAEILGITSTNVGFILHTALKKLRAALKARTA